MKTKERKYYAHFMCNDWDSGPLRSMLISTHFVNPDTKATGVCIIELFNSEEDARAAYPDENYGVLELKEITHKEDKGDK